MSASCFVLGRFAWKPLLAALHNREQHLEHVLLETERARNESEANLAEHRKLMARAGDEVRAILDKARQEAQAAADEIVKQAQGEAEAAKQRAQRDIASARDQALAEIWEKTADMAVSVAGRVLSKELTDAEHRRLLDAAIDELPRLGQRPRRQARMSDSEQSRPTAEAPAVADETVEVARRYAEALIEAAEREGDVEALLDELEEIDRDVLTAFPQFARILASARVPAAEKDRILVELLRQARLQPRAAVPAGPESPRAAGSLERGRPRGPGRLGSPQQPRPGPGSHGRSAR